MRRDPDTPAVVKCAVCGVWTESRYRRGASHVCYSHADRPPSPVLAFFSSPRTSCALWGLVVAVAAWERDPVVMGLAYTTLLLDLCVRRG